MNTVKCTTFFASVIAAVCLSLSASGQTLIWSDEFDGKSIDPNKWTFDVGGSGFGNAELQYYTTRAKNVHVENGELIIQADRENYEGKVFTSARLKSHGRLAMKYGIIEARILVPDLADGLWPAFWLLGESIGQNSWPVCGEIDILEMGSSGAIAGGVVNNRVGGAAHWDYQGNYAGYGAHRDLPFNLYDGYRTFRLEWTPSELVAKIDGVAYWTFNISDIVANSLEEFHEPFFVVLNLAVGGINFVDITDPALITAPFPADLHVDYIRIYDNGFTELTLAEDTAEVGTFGILTETTPTNASLAYGTDAELYIWNNMGPVPSPPAEGSEAWSFNVTGGSWYGMGVYLPQNKNMQHYRNGKLHLQMKTTSTATFDIGIASAAAGEGWLSFVPGGEAYGLVRDGQWHEVVIPLNEFSNVDFHTISQMFMFKGEAPGSAFEIAFDDIYWTPSEPLWTPENGNFGIFTEQAANKTAGDFVLGVDGEFYVWESTLNPLATTPYEGAGAIGLTSAPGLTWFGAAFTPAEPLNLTAFRYANSKLHFAMKTSSNATFWIGMKGGLVDALGQEWIAFEAGNDPYGFVRDGQWHVVEIPMSDLGGVDLTQVSQLFELLGTAGPITDIAIDDICLLNGGAALDDNAGGVPSADAGADQVITLPTSTAVLTGSGSDTDGTIVGYAWSQVSGPSTAGLSGANTTTLTASALVEGTYVFRLTVTDNDNLSSSDTVQVRVATPEPYADAGPDLAIDLPQNSATLFGSGWDSDGTIVGYSWIQISGPSMAMLGGQATDTLTAGNLLEGIYTFELTVTDNDLLTGSDTVQVVVNNPPQNLALGQPATASSQESAGLGPAGAVDGDPGTRWSSVHADPQWIEVDLGAVYELTQVVLVWETASGKTYDIDVSDDGSNWATIYSTSTGAGGTEVIDISTSGRYIRMYGTERNTPWGYSLYEFEVYGGVPVTPGDVDGDGDVDIDDFETLLACLAGPDNGVQIGCTGADLNLDGSVDITDLADWKVLISLP
jgi:beta-glucanase (GH16 family)